MIEYLFFKVKILMIIYVGNKRKKVYESWSEIVK